MLGFPLAVPIVGILITIAIIAVLKGAAVEVFRRLMDGVDPDVTEQAERHLTATPGVQAVRRLRMRWDGHRLTADADIDVDPDLPLPIARAIAHHAEHDLEKSVPKLSVANVHIYPSDPDPVPAPADRSIPAPRHLRGLQRLSSTPAECAGMVDGSVRRWMLGAVGRGVVDSGFVGVVLPVPAGAFQGGEVGVSATGGE